RTGRSAWCDTTTSRRATGRTDVSRPCDATPERERGAGSREQELRASPAPCSPLPAPSRDYIYCRMPTIQIKKTGEEPGAASLAVTVPVEQVREAEARATAVYQRRARLPGFRKGKAPAALVRKQFAEDIRQQALEDLIRESWKAALAQEALHPVADPHVHNLKWDVVAGGPVTFEFHVGVKPELTLERIGTFHLKRTESKATEEQVQAQLAALTEQKAPWVPGTGEKPALKDMG